MDNYENQINDILNQIDYSVIQPLNIVNRNRNNAINTIYKRFLRYDANIENLKEALVTLEGFEFIDDIHKLNKNDKIIFISKRNFVDMVPSNLLSISEVEEDKIVVYSGLYLKNVKVKSSFFFRKIKDDDLVKMKLVEIVNQ